MVVANIQTADPAIKTRPTPDLRLPQLDALRGLAALSVFWGHAFAMARPYSRVLSMLQFTPLHFFYDGTAAVMLFFVLSGFVLNLKYANQNALPQNWILSFITRRIFRIYPAFFIAIALALILRSFVFVPSSMSVFSDWFAGFWRQPLNVSVVVHSLTLIGFTAHSEQIDPPMWSLMYEMRISIFFPVIILMLIRKRHPVADVGLILLIYLIGFCCCRSKTLSYVPLFALGAVCAKYFNLLQSRLRAMPTWKKTAWLLIALLLYEMESITQTGMTNDPYVRYTVRQGVGLGAAGLILASAIFVKVSALLKKSPFQFLGRTSYSFYLVHMLLLFAPAPLIYRITQSYWITWLSTLILAYGMSHLLFKLIEMPAIRRSNDVIIWLVSLRSKIWGITVYFR